MIKPSNTTDYSPAGDAVRAAAMRGFLLSQNRKRKCTCGTTAALDPRMHADHCPRSRQEAT